MAFYEKTGHCNKMNFDVSFLFGVVYVSMRRASGKNIRLRLAPSDEDSFRGRGGGSTDSGRTPCHIHVLVSQSRYFMSARDTILLLMYMRLVLGTALVRAHDPPYFFLSRMCSRAYICISYSGRYFVYSNTTYVYFVLFFVIFRDFIA